MAVSWSVSSNATVFLPVIIISVTFTSSAALDVTVTLQLASFPPSAVVTVISAVPAFTPVTNPSLFTVATAVLLLSHVTLLFVAVEGDTVALRFVVSPTLRLTELLSSLTPVTLIPFTVPLPLVFSTVPLTFTVISTLV